VLYNWEETSAPAVWRLAMRLKVVLEPSDEGGYTVYVPALPGCLSEGDTEEEALANIQEAISLYLEPVDDDLIEGDRVRIQEIEV
jgi:predicted RNase H-like HicB family nuclease